MIQAIHSGLARFFACLAALACGAALAAPLPLPKPDIADYAFARGADAVTRTSIEVIGLDAQGRIYLAGPFDTVNGTPMPGVMRIGQDGTIDTAWQPALTGGTVRKAHQDAAGRILLVVREQVSATATEERLYRVDGGTGGALQPIVSTPYRISAVTTDPASNIFAAIHQIGQVDFIVAAPILRFDGASGAQDSGFQLRVEGFASTCFFPPLWNSRVSQMVHDGAGFLYLVGDFAAQNGAGVQSSIFGAIRVSPQTGLVDTTWTPVTDQVFAAGIEAASPPPVPKLTCFQQPRKLVESIVLDPARDAAYLGGFYVTQGDRSFLGRFSLASPGRVDPDWDPRPAAEATGADFSGRQYGIIGMAHDPALARLYIAGTFPSVAGAPRMGLAAVSTAGNGAVDALWDPAPDAAPGQVFLSGDRVVVGGNFTTFSAVAARARVAALPPAGALIANYYLSILGRAPDAAGRQFWEAQAASLAAQLVDPREALLSMALAFFASPEFRQTPLTDVQYVERLYLTFFDRAADDAGRDFWVGQVQSGLPREAVLLSFLFSPEFDGYLDANAAGLAMRPEVGVVLDFYRGALRRLPDPDGLRHWVNRFRAAQCGPFNPGLQVRVAATDLARLFFGSPEYAGLDATHPQYVTDLYNAFMRRGADTPGFNHWTDQLSTGALSRSAVLDTFVGSAEFAGRVQAVVEAGCTTPMP